MLLLLIITSWMIPSTTFAGDGLRGGGDVIHCVASEKNDFQGSYPLGFIQVMTTEPVDKPSLLFSSSSCDQVLEKLKLKLDAQVPALGVGFSDFLNSFRARSDKNKKTSDPGSSIRRQWVSCKGKDCLNDYKDEGMDGFLVFKLPENCQAKSQYAIRKVKQNNQVTYITYYFNESAHQQLKGPMCAFNLVHEWLRDYESESDELYKATYEIFSNKLVDKIKNKAGLYSYLPEEILRPHSQESAMKIHQKYFSQGNFNCAVDKQTVCHLDYVLHEGSFAFVTNKGSKFWNVVIPRRGHPLKETRVLKTAVQELDIQSVNPDFLKYLTTLNLEKWFGKIKRQHVESRKPAKNP